METKEKKQLGNGKMLKPMRRGGKKRRAILTVGVQRILIIF